MSKNIDIPRRLYYSLMFWHKLAKFIYMLHRKAKWREDLVGIKIYNNNNKQLREAGK